jgi:hypothetical protein
MTRSPGWIHPRKRRRCYLGPCEVTYHALDSYRTRVAPAACMEDLEVAARTSYLIGRTAAGDYVYRADECRFIVCRPARRLPVIMTVLAGEGRRA